MSVQKAPGLSMYSALAGWIAVVTLADPSGGMIDLPVSFILKNSLHLDASEVARFRLVASLPFYASVVFGLARDASRRRGRSDRSVTAVFSLFGVAFYVAFASIPVTVGSLLAAILLATCLFQMVASAQSGFSAELGQHYGVSGQISAIWNVVVSLAASLAFYVGGILSEHLDRLPVTEAGRVFFMVCALLSTAMFIIAASNPGGIFDAVDAGSEREAKTLGFRMTLAKHRSVLPALAIWFLWNFAPGSSTPLQYYLQNELGATNAQWGLWNAVFSVSFVPTLVLYGLLSTRVSFPRLLQWAALGSAPQFVPLLFVHTLNEAVAAAALIGMLGGLATGAYLDLIIRSCPPGLEGTTLMLAGGLYYVATRLGDVVGAYLYDWSGDFSICVGLMTSLYCSILFILPAAGIEPSKTAATVRPG